MYSQVLYKYTHVTLMAWLALLERLSTRAHCRGEKHFLWRICKQYKQEKFSFLKVTTLGIEGHVSCVMFVALVSTLKVSDPTSWVHTLVWGPVFAFLTCPWPGIKSTASAQCHWS